MIDYRIRIRDRNSYRELRKYLRRELQVKGDLWITEPTSFHPYEVHITPNDAHLKIPDVIYWNGHKVKIYIRREKYDI